MINQCGMLFFYKFIRDSVIMNQVWVIGMGGLGKAISNLLQQKNIEVNCFSRTSHHLLDISSETEISQLIDNTSKLPDTIIITPGLLHDDSHMPEKSILAVDQNWLNQSIKINVLPTLFFAKAITKKLNRKNKITVASFSARVSSISDNQLGGWHSYRMSKSMLNMLIKNVSIEWSLKSPQSIIFGYHPGTVDTPLSKPFQSKLKQDQLFSAEQAANYFYECLSSRTQEHNGKLYDWRQQEVYP